MTPGRACSESTEEEMSPVEVSKEITNSKASDVEPCSSDIYNDFPSGFRLAVITTALCLGAGLVALDNTIIGVAIPKISTVFKALDDVGWYGSAYLLTLTALQPSFGNIYKFFHVKSTYLLSIAVFEVGSVLCAAAPSSPAFILGRAIAGVGAAGIFQGALGIIGLTVALEKRPLYLGIVVSVFGFAQCFGPILGGVLTDDVSWRWCFWINVPIGGVVCFLIVIFLNIKGVDSPDRRLPTKAKLLRMDPLGAITVIAAVCCLLLALQWGGTTMPWGSARIIGLFIGFGLLAIAFGWMQWKLRERATIPPRILLQRSVLMGCCYLFFLYMSVYTVFFYLPFYFQAVQGVSAITSGVRIIPLGAPQIVAIVISSVIATKTGHYVPFMILGQIIASIGIGLLTRIGLSTSTIQWAAYLVVSGLGQGMGLQQPFTALQVVLSEADLPIGNAVTVFVLQLGGAIAVSVGQATFLNGLLREVPNHTQAVSAQAVYKAGVANLQKLTSSPDVLLALREAYGNAVTDTLYFAVATSCIAVPFAFGMEWKNIKISAQRAQEK